MREGRVLFLSFVAFSPVSTHVSRKWVLRLQLANARYGGGNVVQNLIDGRNEHLCLAREMSAPRPIEGSEAAVCYVRNTS